MTVGSGCLPLVSPPLDRLSARPLPPAAPEVSVLPAASRLRASADFGATVRSGRRAGRPTLTAHLLVLPDRAEPARAGLVVSKAVGGSVVRHQVARRLRHVLRAPVAALPDGALLVVRAAPAAATATSADLAADLSKALTRLGAA